MSVITEDRIRKLDTDYIASLLDEIETLKHVCEQQLTRLKEVNEDHAKKWKHCLTHRDDLGEWLVDQATINGELTKYTIDAALGGEDFVPNSFTRIVNGTKYAFELVSTVYSVTEAEC